MTMLAASEYGIRALVGKAAMIHHCHRHFLNMMHREASYLAFSYCLRLLLWAIHSPIPMYKYK